MIYIKDRSRCYLRYIEYALGRRTLLADGKAKSWLHKYLLNGEWAFLSKNPIQCTKYSYSSTVLKMRLYNS